MSTKPSHHETHFASVTSKSLPTVAPPRYQ